MHSNTPLQININFVQKVRKNIVWENRSHLSADYEKEAGLIRERDERIYLISYEPEKYELYNPLEKPDLIPSLVRMVEEVWRGRDKKEALLTWTKQWGFLTEYLYPMYKFAPDLKNLHEISIRVLDQHPWIPISKQPIIKSLKKLWAVSEQFAKLWVRYRHVTNRQLDNLKEWIRFELVDYGENESNPYVTVYFRDDAYSLIISNSIEEIEKSPLYFYQAAGFDYILKNVTLGARAELNPISVNFNSTKNQDLFRIQPCLEPHTLLGAMYLQFFLLLCSNDKKICANYKCNKPFEPNRIDQQYCSETCKNTEKSRRQRQRKKTRSVFV